MSCFLTVCTFFDALFRSIFSEEHIQRKIDTSVTEAKAKMAKGDKKGKTRRRGRSANDLNIEYSLRCSRIERFLLSI
jgi:hypothetical protein